MTDERVDNPPPPENCQGVKKNLYALHGDYWTIPIWATRVEGSDMASVTPAVPLLAIQQVAYDETLGRIGYKADTDWMVAYDALTRHASLRSGDPELLLDWRRTSHKVKVAPAGMQDFFAEFAKRGYFRSPASNEVLFKEFCAHMLHWLINVNRPVDLGFCELHPLPLRRNWKEIVLEFHPRATRLTRSAMQMACKMLSLNRATNLIHWSIEVRHKATWWAAVERRERSRRKPGHPLNYYASIAKQIVAALPQITTIYESYLSEVDHPYPKLNTSQRCRNGAFKKLRYPAVKVERSVKPHSFSHCVDTWPRSRREGFTFPVALKDAFVRAMHPLRQKVKDLWKCSRLDRRRRPRVSVLDAPEG